MATFYTAKYLVRIGSEQRVQERDFFLPNPQSVRQEIAEMGGQPLTIHKKTVKWWQREYISGSYKLAFLRGVGFHVNAGMSPGKALWIVIESEDDTKKRLELEPALEVLKRGGGFMKALDELRMFDRGTLAIISAGERIGSLADVMNSAISHLEEKGKIWKILLAAIGWMWFDLGMAISSVFGVQYGYLPYVEEQGIQTKDKALEAEFYSTVETAYFINGALIFIAFAAIIMGVFVFFTIIGARGKLEEVSQAATAHLPIVRPFLENSALAETFGIVGRMVEGRVQFAEAARVAAEATPYAPVRNFWQSVLERVLRGDTIDRAMRSPLLSKGELIELGAHQNATQLAAMILNIANARAEEAKRGLKALIMGSVMFTIFFTFFSAATAMWVLWVQNKGVTASLDSLSTGF